MIAIVFPVLWTLAFLLVKLPVLMVIIGGIATFIMLFLIILAGLYFRFGAAEGDLKHGMLYNTILIVSCIAIFLVGLYGVVSLF